MEKIYKRDLAQMPNRGAEKYTWIWALGHKMYVRSLFGLYHIAFFIFFLSVILRYIKIDFLAYLCILLVFWFGHCAITKYFKENANKWLFEEGYYQTAYEQIAKEKRWENIFAPSVTNDISISTLKAKELSEEINRFNWGAFFLNWIWGVAHGFKSSLLFAPFFIYYYIYLLCIIYVKGMSPKSLSGTFFRFLTLPLLIIMLYYGFRGNSSLWKEKKYETIEDLNKNERKWAIFGIIYLIVTGLPLLPGILAIILMFFVGVAFMIG